jgi:hypothetical protein
MPIPFLVPVLIGGGAALLGALGIGAGLDGVDSMSKAKSIGEDALKKHEESAKKEQTHIDSFNNRALAYGARKEDIANGVLNDVCSFLKEIEKRVKFDSPIFFEKVNLKPESILSFRAETLKAQTILSGVRNALLAGASAGKATALGASLFGVASTGTAIGSLSGAAATNATLAWLGGGSLAAGGGGMALGSVIFGGIVAAPVLAVSGFVLAAEGEKALTQAKLYEAQINEAIALSGVRIDLMDTTSLRIGELEKIIDTLEPRIIYCLSMMNAKTWKISSDSDVNRFRQMMLFSKALADVIRVPILREDGGLSGDLEEVIARGASFC